MTGPARTIFNPKEVLHDISDISANITKFETITQANVNYNLIANGEIKWYQGSKVGYTDESQSQSGIPIHNFMGPITKYNLTENNNVTGTIMPQRLGGWLQQEIIDDTGKAIYPQDKNTVVFLTDEIVCDVNREITQSNDLFDKINNSYKNSNPSLNINDNGYKLIGHVNVSDVLMQNNPSSYYPNPYDIKTKAGNFLSITKDSTSTKNMITIDLEDKNHGFRVGDEVLFRQANFSVNGKVEGRQNWAYPGLVNYRVNVPTNFGYLAEYTFLADDGRLGLNVDDYGLSSLDFYPGRKIVKVEGSKISYIGQTDYTQDKLNITLDYKRYSTFYYNMNQFFPDPNTVLDILDNSKQYLTVRRMITHEASVTPLNKTYMGNYNMNIIATVINEYSSSKQIETIMLIESETDILDDPHNKSYTPHNYSNQRFNMGSGITDANSTGNFTRQTLPMLSVSETSYVFDKINNFGRQNNYLIIRAEFNKVTNTLDVYCPKNPRTNVDQIMEHWTIGDNTVDGSPYIITRNGNQYKVQKQTYVVDKNLYKVTLKPIGDAIINNLIVNFTQNNEYLVGGKLYLIDIPGNPFVNGNNTLDRTFFNFEAYGTSRLEDKSVVASLGTYFVKYINDFAPSDTLEYLDYPSVNHKLVVSNNKLLIDGAELSEINFLNETLYIFDLTDTSLLNNQINFEDNAGNNLLNGSITLPVNGQQGTSAGFAMLFTSPKLQNDFVLNCETLNIKIPIKFPPKPIVNINGIDYYDDDDAYIWLTPSETLANYDITTETGQLTVKLNGNNIYNVGTIDMSMEVGVDSFKKLEITNTQFVYGENTNYSVNLYIVKSDFDGVNLKRRYEKTNDILNAYKAEFETNGIDTQYSFIVSIITNKQGDESTLFSKTFIDSFFNSINKDTLISDSGSLSLGKLWYFDKDTKTSSLVDVNYLWIQHTLGTTRGDFFQYLGDWYGYGLANGLSKFGHWAIEGAAYPNSVPASATLGEEPGAPNGNGQSIIFNVLNN